MRNKASQPSHLPAKSLGQYQGAGSFLNASQHLRIGPDIQPRRTSPFSPTFARRVLGYFEFRLKSIRCARPLAPRTSLVSPSWTGTRMETSTSSPTS